MHKRNTIIDKNQQKYLVQKNLWHQNLDQNTKKTNPSDP